MIVIHIKRRVGDDKGKGSGRQTPRTPAECAELAAHEYFGCVSHNFIRLCPRTCGVCSDTGVGGREMSLWVAYLYSYEHMGIADVSCSGSCSCATEIDAHNTQQRVSTTGMKRLPVRFGGNGTTAGAPCELAIRIKNATTSGERKFKVMGLLIGESMAETVKAQRQSGSRGYFNAWSPPGTMLPAAWTFALMSEPITSND